MLCNIIIGIRRQQYVYEYIYCNRDCKMYWSFYGENNLLLVCLPRRESILSLLHINTSYNTVYFCLINMKSKISIIVN